MTERRRTRHADLAVDRIPNAAPPQHYRFYVDEAWRIMQRQTRREPNAGAP
ncbi:MAG: hypothetical protein ACOC8F_01745 [Planctomycetota bacterium]